MGSYALELIYVTPYQLKSPVDSRISRDSRIVLLRFKSYHEIMQKETISPNYGNENVTINPADFPNFRYSQEDTDIT